MPIFLKRFSASFFFFISVWYGRELAQETISLKAILGLFLLNTSLNMHIIMQIMYQKLSDMIYKGYTVGQGGLEPPTSPLSGVRSNQLSYRPMGSV